jgi:hypothetical protein
MPQSESAPQRWRKFLVDEFLLGGYLGLVVGLLVGLGSQISGLQTPRDWLDTFSKVAPLAAVVAVSIGACIAYLNFRSNREAQQFANAVAFYRRYLEIAFGHTEYAEPGPDGINEDAHPEEFREYEWFLGILFRACEELLEHSGNNPEKWHRTIKAQLAYHKKYLRESDWLNEEGGILSYSRDLQRLIEEVKAEP